MSISHKGVCVVLARALDRAMDGHIKGVLILCEAEDGNLQLSVDGGSDRVHAYVARLRPHLMGMVDDAAAADAD